MVSGYGAGATPRVIPKGGESPEPVFAFQPNLIRVHSLSQEQHRGVVPRRGWRRAPAVRMEGTWM